MKSLSILLLLSCTSYIQAITPQLQLVNYLIANTNFSAILNGPSNYAALDFLSPGTCSQTTSYPTGITSLNVCYGNNVAYPYRNSSNVGYEVELAAQWNSILSANGKSLTLNLISITIGSSGLFASLQSAINSGQCDVAVSSVFETASRDAVLAPSCAYGQTFSAYLVGPKASTVTITNDVSSLNNSAVTIAVATGSASAQYLQSYVTQATLMFTSSTSASIALAQNSTVNVAIGDGPVLSYFAQSLAPTLCNGAQCPVYQLTPTYSKIVAYGLNDTSVATSAPTSYPTSTPTSYPTSAPTTAATSGTAAPTTGTVAPTVKPTSKPTSGSSVVSASLVVLLVAVIASLM